MELLIYTKTKIDNAIHQLENVFWQRTQRKNNINNKKKKKATTTLTKQCNEVGKLQNWQIERYHSSSSVH